jgi:hypothetical protein
MSTRTVDASESPVVSGVLCKFGSNNCGWYIANKWFKDFDDVRYLNSNGKWEVRNGQFWPTEKEARDFAKGCAEREATKEAV